ncbi:MAG: alpha/beta hydrolase [Pseudomonadota bacterium]
MRTSLIILTLLLAAAVFVALSTRAKLAIANLPAAWFDGTISSQILFDPQTGLELDIYAPPDANNAPVVMFWHGGSWRRGQKDQYRFVGLRLAQEGFVAVVPDYRKFPEVRHPAFVEDAAAAIAWVHANIADNGGDPAAIFLSGHSAGAHIAALVAMDPGYLSTHDLPNTIVRGVAGLAGPYHFFPDTQRMIDIFGPEDRFPIMQAGTYARPDSPPILMMHGRDDVVVGTFNIERVEVALAKVGACWGTAYYDDVDHISIVSSFSWVLRDSNSAPADLAKFVRDVKSGQFCRD